MTIWFLDLIPLNILVLGWINISFKTYIKKKCQTAMMDLQRIKTIRHMLSQEACHQLILGLVMSHLDYVNAILINLPQREIHKLQRIQNMAAKIVLCKSKCESSRESLWELHWFPIHRRIQHKILTLVYKCMNGLAPDYLINVLPMHPKSQSLRSDDIYQRLIIPRTKRRTFADRAFSVMGPKLWNQLPNSLKQSTTADHFKRNLKTYIFTQEFRDM